MRKLALCTLIAGFMVSCSPSTQVLKSWKDPEASVSPTDTGKVFVIAMVKDETSRRTVEDELVKRLKAGRGVASYTVMPAEVLKKEDPKALEYELKSGGYSYVTLMRLSNVENEVSYVPGTTTGFYGGYGAYYGYSSHYYSSPGYYQVDKNYTVETIVYSINPEKLVWGGTTSTINPSNLKKTINDIADIVTAQMKKDGFILTK
jgi:hypothetical protein